mgnify:FL=1
MTRHKAYTKIPFAALFFAATLISPALHALNIPDYRFHTMPETSYYGGIHSIAKDSVGRMWFSGYDALFMYNGTSFVRMTDLVTNLSPNSYWSYGQVITDNRKGLYVGTNQGLLRFNYRKLEFEFVLEGNIGSVTANNDGTVWLIRNNGIESFSPERLPAVTRYPMPPEMSAPGRTLTLVCTKEYVYAASGGDLYRLNRETGQYVLFASVGGGSCVIRDVVECNGSVYVLTLMDGLYECDGNGRIGRYFRLPLEYEKSAGAKELHLDSQGIIWVATQSGLLLLEPLTASTQLLRSDLHYPYSLPNNSVWSIFPDPDGGIWVGTYGGKLAYMTFADNGVDYFKATPGGLNHPIVSCFEEDSEGNLWIGTEGGGINRWDRRDGRFVYYTQESRCGLTSNMIKKLWHDGNDRLLVSAFNGGMRVFDERQGRFSDLHMNHPASGQPLSVYDFVKEGDRGIWLTDPDAELMYKDASTGRVETVRLTDAQGNAVRIHIETLFHDERGNLWLVGHDGAYVVDPATRRILKRHYIAEAPYSVNNLCSYCVTSDSDIWFGTRGGGVNLLSRNGSYVNFRDRNGEGLEGKTVFGILEDTPSKDVWFSTNDGLYYYDHTDGVIRKSQIDIPNRCGAYYVRACYKTSKGEMLFGGTDGFILFTPGKIKYNDQKPKVYFTDLLINSRPAVPGAKNSPLEKAISTLSYRGGEGDVIELSHRQSNFEIRFSANSYLNAEKNQYAYRLLGHSERWSLLPQGQKAVQFFNLPAGNYVFEVKAANNDGLWGDEVSALGFRVHPSPFLSRWAYLVYAALLSAVAYFIWRYFTNKKIFEQRLELERIKEQNMKQLTQARINFFTNISHDLKTPLTLVVDPLKQLKEHLPANAPGNAYVHLIEKNVGRIQRMISQLLQFREIESQKITLNRQPGDLIRFIDSIFSLFEFYANKKGIETGFNSQYESFYTKFDHDVIEKIFTNLFSNAIKYASENGYVGVRIYPARQDQRPESAPPAAGTEYIAFTVTNTGAEIPDDKKEAIFESFNHLSDRRPQFESSSGLGLAIVKELVGNLNGTITLRSGNSKVAFTVVLPFTLNAEKTDSAAESYEYTVSEIDNLLTESDVMAPNDRHDRKACNIVVIEDDPNLRSYLEQRLSKHYNVYTAANGSEGIAKAERICPQIVITDLMMPEADGFEVCRSLRSNIKTSHIPVIMLSALGKNTENKIKALECGASVFIDKPFDMDFLLRQVANLIKNQKELKELYSKKFIAEPSKITISSMDEELLKKAMNYIERNMDNSDYNVDSFVSDMSIGRTLLYQKINDITGMSIKEFIMDVRLKRSAQLLRESDLTISEISVLTGFANPKYFSICFKRHFELTPSEFKKKS